MCYLDRRTRTLGIPATVMTTEHAMTSSETNAPNPNEKCQGRAR